MTSSPQIIFFFKKKNVCFQTVRKFIKFEEHEKSERKAISRIILHSSSWKASYQVLVLLARSDVFSRYIQLKNGKISTLVVRLSCRSLPNPFTFHWRSLIVRWTFWNPQFFLRTLRMQFWRNCWETFSRICKIVPLTVRKKAPIYTFLGNFFPSKSFRGHLEENFDNMYWNFPPKPKTVFALSPKTTAKLKKGFRKTIFFKMFLWTRLRLFWQIFQKKFLLKVPKSTHIFIFWKKSHFSSIRIPESKCILLRGSVDLKVVFIKMAVGKHAAVSRPSCLN